MAERMLEVEDLNVSYGHVHAVKGIDLHVDKGEMVAVVGANGAGKTSLLNALLGVVPSTGTVRFDGQPLGKLKPHQRVKRGLVLVPEGRGILRSLSVHENLLMGAYPNRRGGGIDAMIDSIYDRFPSLRNRANVAAGYLSGGEQQMLAVGRALAAGPSVLVLDEPSLGLAPKLIQSTLDSLSALRDDGLTVLLVEQNVRQALKRADRAYVLTTGSVTAAGPAGELLDNSRVQEAFLGKANGSAEE